MKHLRLRGAAVAVLIALLAPLAPRAFAQDNQIAVLAQQIQRLRDDLSLLQRDYYQGRGGTPPAPAAARCHMGHSPPHPAQAAWRDR